MVPCMTAGRLAGKFFQIKSGDIRLMQSPVRYGRGLRFLLKRSGRDGLKIGPQAGGVLLRLFYV
jgi:hypothetical protein